MTFLEPTAGAERAVLELAHLVIDEYPSDLSLREIVETWGRIGTLEPEALEALDRIDAAARQTRGPDG